MYMDNIKLFAKYEKKGIFDETIRIYTQDIGMEFSIEKCPMLIMKNWKKDWEILKKKLNLF